MSQASQYAAPFRATLDSTLGCLRELLQILNAEQSALTGQDPERLEGTVKTKTELLKRLAQSIQAREQLLKHLRLPGGQKGTELFIRQHFSPSEILSDWQELQTLSHQVDELNTQNGKLAFSGERSTRQALSILTGRNTRSDTYKRQRNHSIAGSGNISLGKC